LIGPGERFRQVRTDNEYVDGATCVKALSRDCRRVGLNNLDVQTCAVGREGMTKMVGTVDAGEQDSI
jgi:hypothetical protein